MSENTISITGRGFRTALEASVICEAIEKSSLDPEIKNLLKAAILERLVDNGFVKVEEFTAWLYDQFPEDSTIVEAVNSIINSLLP